MKNQFETSFYRKRLLWKGLLVLVVSLPILVSCHGKNLKPEFIQFESTTEALTKLRKALEPSFITKNYNLALQNFEKCFKQVKELKDNEIQLKDLGGIWEFMGDTAMLFAKQSKDLIQKSQWIEKAAQSYQETLELQPNHGPFLDKLAQAYAQIGRVEDAINLFTRAINLNDSKQALYAENFAKLMLKEGKYNKAIELNQLSLKTQPENILAHRSLVEAYISINSLKLLPYLWDSLDKGMIIHTQESVLKALDKGEWSDETKIELLTIQVVSLSKCFYHPKEFLETPTSEKLKAFLHDEIIGDGVEEVLLLHNLENPDPYQFKWWRIYKRYMKNAPKDFSSQDAFKMLIRSLGSWYQQANDFSRAETYYMLAAIFNEYNPDPEAFLNLADLYNASGDLSKLDILIDRYGSNIFHGKAIAYRNEDMEKIYECHKALGVIYALNKNWGSRYTPTSAIFQLEHAIEVAERFNHGITQAEERIHVDPRLINFLADGYETKNLLEKAYKIRFDGANNFIKYGDKISAQKVLKPITEKGLLQIMSIEDKNRFNELMNKSLP